MDGVPDRPSQVKCRPCASHRVQPHGGPGNGAFTTGVDVVQLVCDVGGPPTLPRWNVVLPLGIVALPMWLWMV